MANKKNPLADSIIDSLLEDIQDVEKSHEAGNDYENHDGEDSKEAPSGFFLGPAEDFSVEKTFVLVKSQNQQQPNEIKKTEVPLLKKDLIKNKKNEEDVLNSENIIPFDREENESEKTVAIAAPQSTLKTKAPSYDENTIAVTSIQEKRKQMELEKNKNAAPAKQKNYENNYPSDKVQSTFNLSEAGFIQGENLKLAQKKILQLEAESDRLRSENDELANAGQILKSKIDELNTKNYRLELDKNEFEKTLNEELQILRSSLQYKDKELNNEKDKSEQLSARLKTDFKKIRVKERELENRLELAKLEKTAIVKSKDETILDLKRKIDHLEGELEFYTEKCNELNKKLDSNQEQFKRTVKALRLALSNLEVSEEIDAILKKAQ